MPILAGAFIGYFLTCASQAPAQDTKILERGDQLLSEAKSAYEEARSKGSVPAFIDAGFKLEEARIKFIVLQEIGSSDKQKIAADRLRAVNQLGKLIHDGKVAISGASAGPPGPATPNPPEVRAPSEPPGKSDSTVRPSVGDVTVRLPIPDAAKQRESEKLVKDLFKEQYVKKAPADRQALAQALLDQAEKTPEDPVARWVLYQQAQEVAVQVCDLKLVTSAIDLAARTFDLDALGARLGAFISAAKFAKQPSDFAALADGFLGMVEELINVDQYDGVDKAISAALQYSRKASDVPLVARAGVLAREAADAKAKFQAMKSALETLAKTPEEPVANYQMGLYLCTVKGNWDLGLRFIVKGSDPTLKELAGKELLLTLPAQELVAAADAWFDLGDKEKSPLCKRQLFTHAKNLYERAIPDSTGLILAKIEKRLDSLASAGVITGAPVIDLTSLTPKRATVGYFTLGVNSNSNNILLMVAGKECKQYLFAHAPSSLVYELPPRVKTFTSTGTKLDKTASFIKGSWKYLVIVDGKTLYESKPLSEVKGSEVEISVALPPGAKEIELKVDDLGDNNSDWSVWAYPRFVR